jgi:hypothetical protein
VSLCAPLERRLLGNYVVGNFHMANDGNGGTLVTDPPVDPPSFGQALHS